MKKKLFLLPLPPPYAGPEIMAENFLNSNKLTQRDDIIYINSTIRKLNSDKGKFNFKGFVLFLKIYLRYIYILFNSDKLFMYLSSSKIGFLRDSVYIITCWIFRKKCIAQYHGSHFRDFYISQNKFYQRGIRFSLSKLSLLLVLGNGICENFSDIYWGNIQILRNGIKSKLYKPKVYIRKNFTILFLGHLIYSKGFYDLVHAYKMLYNKFGNHIRFIFAGENVGFKKETAAFLNGHWKKDFLTNGLSKDKEIQYFIKNSNIWNAQYLGVISGHQKMAAFETSDIFVLPSYTEGFSMACLEAMAKGLAVITTPVGAMPEVVKHNENGLITEIGNPNKLADDIEYFIKNKEKAKRIGQNNVQYVRQNFDIEIIVNKLLRIIDE